MTGPEATIWLGQKQLELYRSAPDVYIRAFKGGSANRAIISQYYGMMVRKRPEMALERTEPAYRQELKAMAVEYGHGLDVTGVMAFAKLLHLIAQDV